MKGNYAACYGSWKYAQSIEGGPDYDGLSSVAVSSDHTIPDGNGPSWPEALGILTATRNSVEIVRSIDTIGDPYPQRPPEKHAGALPRMYGSRNGTKIEQVADGLSKTILISELLPVDTAIDSRGLWTSSMMGSASFTTLTPPNAVPTETMVHPLWNSFTIRFRDKFLGCDRRAQLIDPNLLCTGSALHGDEWVAARSAHDGGVNVGFADGNVSFVSNDIDYLIWNAMGSRAGGRVGGENTEN